MEKKIEKKSRVCETSLAVYLVMFAALKPITTSFPQYSTAILFVCTLLLLSRVFFEKTRLSLDFKCIFLAACIMLLLVFEVLFRSNSSQSRIIYEFIIYGAIPLFLLSKVKDINCFAYRYSILSVVIGVMYLFDPLNSYRWSSDYMVFGFSAMLPAICGCIMLIHLFEKRGYIFLLLIFLISSLIFANKGVFISAAGIVVISFVIFTKNTIKKTFLIVLVVLLMIYINPIISAVLESAINIADYLQVDSYALRTFRIMFIEGRADVIYDTRLGIWNLAQELFLEKPILGYGIGYFESKYNSYAHNIFMDIMVSLGVGGLTFFAIFLLMSLKKLMKIKDKYIFGVTVIFLLSWILPLQVSSSFWKTSSFWVYWGFIIFSFTPSKKVEQMKGKYNERIDSKL